MGDTIKSGGSVKFDIAESLNTNFAEINNEQVRKLVLAKCPDP
jgi:hypothetical protein